MIALINRAAPTQPGTALIVFIGRFNFYYLYTDFYIFSSSFPLTAYVSNIYFI